MPTHAALHMNQAGLLSVWEIAYYPVYLRMSGEFAYGARETALSLVVLFRFLLLQKRPTMGLTRSFFVLYIFKLLFLS